VIAVERRAAVSVSLAGVTTPFVLGALAALAIHPAHDTAVLLGSSDPVAVDRLAFALFCGLAIAGSAFAILARILDERNLFRTRIGSVLLASTVVDDVTVWMLASVVLTVAAAGSALAVPLTLGGLALFVAVLFVAVRPMLARVLGRTEQLTAGGFAVLLLGLLLAASFTTWLGISPILGAFFYGAAVPRQGLARQFAEINVRLESLSVLVLLPVFFAVTGLGVDLSTIGLEGLALLVLFVAVATLGKLIGGLVGCGLNGIRGRRAAAVGVLMNTRGLSELALITIGRSLGVFDTTMFTVLVCTAIATTLVSGPLLGLVYPRHLIAADIAASERSRLAAESAYRVLVLVDADDQGTDSRDAAVRFAVDLARSERDSEVVLSRITVSGPRSELGSGFLGDLGAMTDALEAGRALAAEVQALGVAAVPQSVFAHDLQRELLAQVERLRPHLVVLDGGDARVTSDLVDVVVRDGEVDVAVVRGGERAPIGGEDERPLVRIAPGPEPDQALAIELGVRLACGTGSAIEARHRRSAVLDDLCEQLGVARRPALTGAEPDVICTTIAPGGEVPGSGPSIVARAHTSTAGPRQLGRLRERLARTTAAEAPPI
jgi:Kef-type K+ transport system membrane component KefB